MPRKPRVSLAKNLPALLNSTDVRLQRVAQLAAERRSRRDAGLYDLDTEERALRTGADLLGAAAEDLLAFARRMTDA